MRNTPTTTPTVAPIITPRLLESPAFDVAAFEIELGVDADPVASVAAALPALLVGAAVLEATTLSPFTGHPKTVKVDPSGTTVDVIVHDQVLPSVSGILNWSSHVSDCWAVTVDVHCEGKVALAKSGTLSL